MQYEVSSVVFIVYSMCRRDTADGTMRFPCPKVKRPFPSSSFSSSKRTQRKIYWTCSSIACTRQEARSIRNDASTSLTEHTTWSHLGVIYVELGRCLLFFYSIWFLHFSLWWISSSVLEWSRLSRRISPLNLFQISFIPCISCISSLYFSFPGLVHFYPFLQVRRMYCCSVARNVPALDPSLDPLGLSIVRPPSSSRDQDVFKTAQGKHMYTVKSNAEKQILRPLRTH